jgi:hypothetical protein
MVSAFQAKPPAPTILIVSSGGTEIARVSSADVPARHCPSLELSADDPTLTFTDSEGQSYVHDLSSALAEGLPWVHLDVRVSQRFAAEADCLLSASPSSEVAEEEFRQGGKAIRFQPFYLPEMTAGNPQDLVGKGFFFRGLHFPGMITPGNVSLGCICDVCRRSFRLQCFHAGFSDLVYFFCDGGPHTLTVSSYVEGTPPLLEYAPPERVAPLEAQLPACERCGGAFRYLNPFLCPHCRAPYIDFQRYPLLRATEYYGCHLYGERTQRWEP